MSNTDAGSEMILRYLPGINATQVDVLSALRPEEADQLTFLLRKLHRSALRVSGGDWD